MRWPVAVLKICSGAWAVNGSENDKAAAAHETRMRFVIDAVGH